MKIYKRILSLILVIAMVAGYLPENVLHVHAEEASQSLEEETLSSLEKIDSPVWESGTIASASGLNTANNTRLRTSEYLNLSAYAGVSIDAGYTMTNFVYDKDMNYLGTSSWLGNGMSFKTADLQEKYQDGVYFRVALRTMDSAVLVAEDLEATGVKFYLPGEEVPVSSYETDLEKEVVGNVGSYQDSAIFNGKLFLLGGAGTDKVVDVDTLETLGSLTLEKTDVLKPHANSVCIYNNYSSAADRMEGTVCVYRIVETDEKFTGELVQVIRIGFTEDLTLWKSKENNGDVRPYGNFVVDTDNSKLYAYVMRDAGKETRFFKFGLPKLIDGEYNETFGCNLVTL